MRFTTIVNNLLFFSFFTAPTLVSSFADIDNDEKYTSLIKNTLDSIMEPEDNELFTTGLSSTKHNKKMIAVGETKFFKFSEHSLKIAIDYLKKTYPSLAEHDLLPHDYVHKDQYLVITPFGYEDV
ncbi:uncharacterized protein SCDLUD_004555 [Saccharomycodes ludwigii]|uniref:uncharacterized protein n=1 Tax=Saccharomycodes ludwigii TaxID=36035 RepID=UPI001E8503F4|nr:hypothetical protein SCDLUD_004555 [Saccharomycodes ludwigii]KAH3899129.1 hypothetical protein SCDLUD_004555 [Saccharomycodes ludwigii]